MNSLLLFMQNKIVTIAIVFFMICAQSIAQDSLVRKIGGYWDIDNYYPEDFNKRDTTLMVLNRKKEVCSYLYFDAKYVILYHYEFHGERGLKALQEKYEFKNGTYIAKTKNYGTFYFKVISCESDTLSLKFWRVW